MPRISDEEWPRFFDEPMQRLSQDEAAPFDFWSYVEDIPGEDFDGYDCSEGKVDYVYIHPAGRWEHVLIESDNPDVFMVVVLDRATNSVVGHHLLDLPALYGLRRDCSNGSAE